MINSRNMLASYTPADGTQPGVEGVAPGPPKVGIKSPTPAPEVKPQPVGVPGNPFATAPATPVVPAPVSAKAAPVASAAPVAQVPSIGVPGNAAPASNVGLSGQTDAPRPTGPGVQYHGSIEGLGPRHEFYSTPEQRQAEAARQATVSRQGWDKEQHGMIRASHAAFMNAADSVQRGLMDPGALRGFGEYTNAMNLADTHGHIAQAQFGNDPTRTPAYQQAVIAHMNAQGEHMKAQADLARNQADPEKQIKTADALARANPRALGVINMLKGNDPNAVNSLPMDIAGGGVGVQGAQPARPGIHPGNIDQALATSPQLAGAAKYLNDAEMPWDQVTNNVSHMDGFADPNSPMRQAYNAALVRKFPTQGDYQKFIEGFPAFGPDQFQTPVGTKLNEGVLGPVMALLGQFTRPFGGRATGTGPGWRQQYERGQEYFGRGISYPKPQ